MRQDFMISKFTPARGICYLRSLSKHTSYGLKILNVSILGLMIAACEGAVTDNGDLQDTSIVETTIPAPETTTSKPEAILSGSVGDGPITNAQIKITDATGAVIGAAVSDTTASYTIDLPQGTAYPVVVEATGGTDMVSGAGPDFTMLSVAMDSSANTVNINPFSTLIVKTAQAMPDGLTPANISAAKLDILDQLNFGLDPALVPDTVTTPINEANVAAIIKASESLGEVVRRTRSTLQVSGIDLTGDDIIDAIATDMTDGIMDGRGAGANPQMAATVNIVSGQVLVEALVNELNVNGFDATLLMDNAIRLSVPNATMTTSDVLINYGALEQARIAVAAAQVHSPSSNLTTVALILASLSGNSLAADIALALPADPGNAFDEAVSLVAVSTETQLEAVNASVRAGNTVIAPEPAPAPAPEPAPTPATSFEFDLSAYSVGESDGAVNITINRIGSSAGEVIVEWRTITSNGFGTADWASDYDSFLWADRSLIFADGETSKVEQITINPDTVIEGNETFTVLLRNPQGDGAEQSTVVTIVDDVNGIAPAPTPAPAAPTDQSYEDLVSKVVGFGDKTTGGQGGALCAVTSLANSGAGTLRSCLESTGARWVHFNVSGVIDLAASSINAKSNKTVDGRGANITIVNGGINLNGIENVIIHNVKFSDQSSFIGASNKPVGIPYLNILRNSRNIWIDHVTISNNEDDPVQIGNTGTGTSPRNITISWCKWENKVNKALAIGFNPTKFPDDINITVTLHHNFFNDTIQRQPRVSQAKVHTFNNYVYSWGGIMPSSDSVQNAELFSENNIYEAGSNKLAIGTTNVGSGVTEAGFVRSKTDLLLNGARVEQRLPANVFTPDSYYLYAPDKADLDLKDLIVRESGWRSVSAPAF